MMTFSEYAQYYDVFYKGKEYKKECSFVESLIKKHGMKNSKSILDLGCGTGGHSITFGKHGYDVTGVDRSANMLKFCKDKFHLNRLKGKFVKANLNQFNLRKKYDVVISMFSVIDYLVVKKDLIKTFENVYRHMKPQALFIFDFWQLEAVEAYYSPKKDRDFYFNNTVVNRQSATRINKNKRLAEVHYRCTVKSQNQRLKKFQEKHILRYFSLEEMEEYLKLSRLKVVGAYPFGSIKGKIRKNTWDVTMVAKKRS